MNQNELGIVVGEENDNIHRSKINLSAVSASTASAVSALRKTYPEYYISKNKIQLTPAIDVDAILIAIKDIYKQFEVNDIDGVKIDFPTGWVHLRKSNTEPIIRIYSESGTPEQADAFAKAIIKEIKRIANI